MLFYIRNTLLLFLQLPFVLFGQDIFDAARTGNIQKIEALIKISPDTVNSKNAGNFTALILAGYYNQVQTAEFLLKHGAKINAGSPEGPVLLGACYKGNLELTRLLIEYKADVNATNETGTTALMYAVMSGKPELIRLLLAHGADKTMKEKSGRTAMTYAELRGSNEILVLLKD